MPNVETKNQTGHHLDKELNILVQSFALWILLLAAMALLWLILFLAFEILFVILSSSWAGSFAAAFVSSGVVVTFAAIIFRIRFR